MTSNSNRIQTGVEVELIGHDGNAFNIMGRVQRELRRHHDELPDGVTVEAVMDDLKASESYNDLLQRTMAWVEVS